MKSSTTYQLTLLVLIGFFFTSCLDFSSLTGGEGEIEAKPRQTTIIRTEIEPNPVVAGEDITFTSIIKDSLDSGFKYQWSFYLDNDTYLDSTSTKNSITITSPDVPGLYEGYITVYKDLYDPNSWPASVKFEFPVIE